jgi:hypothetical protein
MCSQTVISSYTAVAPAGALFADLSAAVTSTSLAPAAAHHALNHAIARVTRFLTDCFTALLLSLLRQRQARCLPICQLLLPAPPSPQQQQQHTTRSTMLSQD